MEPTESEKQEKTSELERLVKQFIAWSEKIKSEFKATGFLGKKWWKYIQYPFASLVVWLYSLTKNIENSLWRNIVFIGLLVLVMSALGILLFYLILLSIVLAIVAGLLWLGYKTFEKSRAEQKAKNSTPQNAVHVEAVPVDGSAKPNDTVNAQPVLTGTTVSDPSTTYENSEKSNSNGK